LKRIKAVVFQMGSVGSVPNGAFGFKVLRMRKIWSGDK